MKICKIIFDFNRTIYDPESNQLIPGVENVLKQLSQSYELGLISRGGEGRDKQINQLGIKKYFSYIMIVDEKELAHFKQFVDLMRVPAEQIAVVGDRVRSEIKHGNMLGMYTIWYRQGKFAQETPETDEEKPDKIIFELTDLLKLKF